MSTVNDNKTISTIAYNTKRLLSERGWSQSELARQCNEPVMNISRVVNGLNMPGAGLVGRIAKALGVPVGDLYMAKKSSRRSPALASSTQQHPLA